MSHVTTVANEAKPGRRSPILFQSLVLTDPDKRVATAWGAWGEKVMYGKKMIGMIRSTFVIDGQGLVRKVFPRVRVEGHVGKVLESLKALG